MIDTIIIVALIVLIIAYVHDLGYKEGYKEGYVKGHNLGKTKANDYIKKLNNANEERIKALIKSNDSLEKEIRKYRIRYPINKNME